MSLHARLELFLTIYAKYVIIHNLLHVVKAILQRRQLNTHRLQLNVIKLKII